MSSSPLDCWLTPPTNRQARRRRRAAPQISKMNVERLEAREVPAIFAPSDISGRVFEDCNLNGVLDAGEEPIAGVTITLTGTDAFHHAVTTVVTTGAEGAFSFTKLEPGQYTITETQPSDFFNGKTIVGTIAGQPASENGTAGSDAVSGIVLEGGDAHGSGYNFTEYAKNTLSGTVFLDLNDNGQQDAGEGGITGATLILSGTDDLGVSANQTVTSAADGTYSFASLRPGAYSITETNPAGILDGPAIPGTVDGKITGTVADAHHIVNITEDGCHSGVGFNFTGKKNQPPTNSISGFVYGDCNNNGVFDAGEMGIAGVAIELTGVTSTGQDVGVFAATTNTDGKYEFDHLPAGTYRISETQPAAFFDGKETLGAPFRGTVGNDVFSDVVIPTSPSQAGANYNFGELQPSTLAGTVFLDANANGTQDAGETGVTGVTLFLAGTNDLGQMIFTSTTSGADGAYQFMPLRPGHYTIIEVQPPNLLSTKNTVGTAGGLVLGDVFANVDLMACTSAAGYNYGEQPCTSPPAVTHKLSGFVFEDCNFNGAFDAGEEPIANVVVILTGTDISGNAVSIRAATDGSGQYQFVNLAAGHYTVTEVQPAGFLDNKESVGTPFGGIADTKIGDDFISNIVIPDSMTPLSGVNYNFGEVGASISGQIYEDLNNNGVRDAGENLIAEPVTVTLTGTDDTGAAVSISTVTTTGEYKFDLLRPGQYSLHESQPAGFDQGTNAVGTPLGGQLQDVDNIVNISADGCHAGTGYNFGEHKHPPTKASLSGFVFEDCNFNGAFDAGEEPIAGVTLILTGADGSGASVAATATTGADGKYAFDNLPAGTYQVVEVQPTAFLDGKDAAGTPFGGTVSGKIGEDVISGFVIPAGGGAGVNYNFGEVGASISGQIYEDLNGNGARDAGENLITAPVTVTLTGTDDTGAAVSISTVTTSGTYLFDKLRPGSYNLAEAQPDGFLQGKNAVGTPLGGQLQDADQIVGISVDGCHAGAGYNFGECPPASVSGFVYLDTGTPTGTTITAGYNDGILQNTEEQIAGATITLTGTDDMGQSVSLTTTTGLVTGRGAGYYEFKGLSPGTYSIHESNSGKLPLPDGRVLIDGKDTPGTPAGSVSTVNDLISNVVLPCGFNGVNNNFGELAPSNVADIVPTSIGGMVWFDINCNGVQNTGERGIAGVSIVLTGNEFNPNTNLFENVTLTTTTDANGNYTFSQLFQGTYTIHEVQPAGFQQGATLPGTPFGGGVVAVDTVGNISVPRFDTDTLNGLSPPLGVNYNFGECKSATKRNFLASSRVQLTMP